MLLRDAPIATLEIRIGGLFRADAYRPDPRLTLSRERRRLDASLAIDVQLDKSHERRSARAADQIVATLPLLPRDGGAT